MFARKILISCFVLFMAVLFGSSAYAVPAAPVIHTLGQPDGSTFEARQWGDEWLRGWETVEGYSIVFDKDLEKWAYATHGPDGALVSSSRVVGKDLTPEVSKRIRPKGQARLTIPEKRFSKEIASEAVPEGVVPPTGTGKIPVILVNFNNTTTTYTAGQFDTLLFGTLNNSMKDYYQQVSYGAFSVSGGSAGVMGWYTASNTHDYYGTDSGGTGNDAWPGTLVYEAVVAADATVNFAEYDTDGDCYVDVVAIVHQGTGQEASGVSTDIWSHSWNLNSAQSYGRSSHGAYTTNDPCPAGGFIKINDYIIQPEKTSSGGLQTIGVFAHEYGHALGLPDLYDTDGSSEGIGNWSLMAAGSWNSVTNPGDRPAHMDAWSKYKLGWVTPTQVAGTLINESIQQAATAADVYKFRTGTANPPSGEYFLVENRQKSGFDQGLPGAGLLIWHIDESKTTNQQECPGGPPCSSHYKVALVQADGLWDLENNTDRGDAGDPFPGSANKTSFDGCTSPNSKLYNGNASGVSITNISASASTMTATLSINGPLTCGGGSYIMIPIAPYSYIPDANNLITAWVGGGIYPPEDEGYFDLSLVGFDFQFYRTPVTSVRISTNGYVTFGTYDTYWDNLPIPNAALPNAIIAPFWDDLDLTGLASPRGVRWRFYGAAPNRYLVIEWYQVPGYGYPTSAYSFEIILYESTDRIKLQYLDVDSATPDYDFGAGATVGIENFDGTSGLQFSYNTASLSNGKAIEFIPYSYQAIVELVTDYYFDILDRAPEPGGAESWTAEIERIMSLGIDIKEGFIAVGKVFFNSPEYLSKGKTNTAYVLDLYRAFLNRTPSQPEVDSWLAYLTQGVSRNEVLNFFVFSAEFNTYMAGIFGASMARPENNLVNDFYRGLLSRLPDTAGYNAWLAQMRAAQCTGAQQVRDLSYQIASLFVASPEYVARGRTNSGYVEDLYDAILRRGAAPWEITYWLDILNGGTMTRGQVLQFFTNSPEFQIRVTEVINAGC